MADSSISSIIAGHLPSKLSNVRLFRHFCCFHGRLFNFLYHCRTLAIKIIQSQVIPSFLLLLPWQTLQFPLSLQGSGHQNCPKTGYSIIFAASSMVDSSISSIIAGQWLSKLSKVRIFHHFCCCFHGRQFNFLYHCRAVAIKIAQRQVIQKFSVSSPLDSGNAGPFATVYEYERFCFL